MKLTVVCLLAAIFAAVGSVSAQEKGRDYSEEKLKLRAEMMALDMAEKYDLDEKQVEKLAEANLEWLRSRGDVPAFRRPGLRPDGDRRWAGRHHHRRPAHYRDGCCGAPCRPADPCCGVDGRPAPDCPFVEGERRPPLSEEELAKRKVERQEAFEKHRAAWESYDKSLQKIMTDEQYKAYRESFRRR